jgi:hypothetical protein
MKKKKIWEGNLFIIYYIAFIFIVLAFGLGLLITSCNNTDIQVEECGDIISIGNYLIIDDEEILEKIRSIPEGCVIVFPKEAFDNYVCENESFGGD